VNENGKSLEGLACTSSVGDPYKGADDCKDDKHEGDHQQSRCGAYVLWWLVRHGIHVTLDLDSLFEPDAVGKVQIDVLVSAQAKNGRPLGRPPHVELLY
jgi:hypothetical protein